MLQLDMARSAAAMLMLAMHAATSRYGMISTAAATAAPAGLAIVDSALEHQAATGEHVSTGLCRNTAGRAIVLYTVRSCISNSISGVLLHETV